MERASDPEVESKMTVVEFVRPEGEEIINVFVSAVVEERVEEVLPEESVGGREEREFAEPETSKETEVPERALPKESFRVMEMLE